MVIFDSSPNLDALLGIVHAFVGVSTIVPHFGHVTTSGSLVIVHVHGSPNPKYVVFQKELMRASSIRFEACLEYLKLVGRTDYTWSRMDKGERRYKEDYFTISRFFHRRCLPLHLRHLTAVEAFRAPQSLQILTNSLRFCAMAFLIGSVIGMLQTHL